MSVSSCFLGFSQIEECPLRGVILSGDERHLHGIELITDERFVAPEQGRPTSLQMAVIDQIQAYLEGTLAEFTLPLKATGTSFQKKVWQEMLQIEYGRTATYGEIAARVGGRNKARAVGGAANRNPLPLVIPCHRVMGANGSLTGFAAGTAVKDFLLKHEQRYLGS